MLGAVVGAGAVAPGRLVTGEVSFSSSSFLSSGCAASAAVMKVEKMDAGYVPPATGSPWKEKVGGCIDLTVSG